MTKHRWEIRIAGFGGQGVILAGHLLGKAAALYGGLESCVSQAYGPEARGGACHSDVIVSSSPILYPVVSSPAVQVLLSQEAYDRYSEQGGAHVLRLIDGDLVQGAANCHRIFATRIAQELGNRLGANVVMLGALAAITGMVSRPALEQAIRTTVRERLVAFNLEALARGLAAGEAITAGGSASLAHTMGGR